MVIGRRPPFVARVSFVGLGALALAVGGVADASLTRTNAAPPPNPIQVENAMPGNDPAEWLPPTYPPTRIEGYVSETSVLPGESVRFHVSTRDGDRYRIEVYRLGWYGGRGARLLACLPDCGSDRQGRALGSGSQDALTGVVRAGWPVTDTLAVRSGWVTGYYYALLRLTNGGDETGARGYVPFVVRERDPRHSQIVVQVPVNTWQAYNPWGGKSLYPFNSTDLAPAVRVSFDRPLAFTAQGPFDWEYNLVRFLEREGYDVSYQTNVDADRRPESLLEHRLIVVAGHDEYWSKRIRDAFDAARAAGTNLAFMGSNAAYWQIRYEDGGRTLVGYKEAAPDPEPNPALRTVRFRQLTPPRPECELMGEMFYRIREHQTGPVDYTVTTAARDDPWLADTGLAPGDRILDVVGNEWDSLPEAPAPAECTKPGLKVFLHYEGTPANADAVRYTAPSGARVFAGGAQQLAWSLDPFNTDRFGRTLPADTRVQQFVRNALDDLGRPASPKALQAAVLGRKVTLRVTRHPDPRVRSFTIVRHRGPAPFSLGDAGVTRVCVTTNLVCVNRRVPRGTYRYAAVAEDDWGSSFPAISRKVIVRPVS
jgi:N,N-dimethylformamidase beta subunit-like, C-terminal